MAIGSRKFLSTTQCVSLFITLWFGVGAHAAGAQNSSQGSAGAAGSSASANGAANDAPGSDATNAKDDAAILQELEQMRARIAELEAQLKAKSAHSAVASAPPAMLNSAAAPANAASNANVAADASAQETMAAPATAAEKKPAKAEPFVFADFTWLNGNSREKTPPIDTLFFTPEFRADTAYIYDFNHPADDTIGGSSEVFRAQEVQLTQLGIGGDFHYDNVRGRLMTQFGMYSQTTPRNDASPARGQWNLADAYRYLSEAYGGYHWNALRGVNLDAGIFMSYVGLFSYYNFDNWAYQPSYVSSNTPWFFNGVRAQFFVTDKLKIEPWFINGWQSYGRFNNKPGLGGQILWRPTGWFEFVGNQYGLGQDDLGVLGRSRIHTDDSIQVKYFDRPDRTVDKMAFSLTGDLGCEYGGGVSCHGNTRGGPKQSFVGYMVYNRIWLDRDKFGLTFGGGKINNPGRYLVLLPPINGATAASGTPYFTENPGQPFKAWDASGTFDYMPSQYITFRTEFDHRAANVPYFSGPGGITPPEGNTGAPGSVVPGWTPDLKKIENRIDLAIMVKF
ncbi:MAG: outer membrane beta-barrel protein [Candidatus Acidiferrales bacterium]